MGTKTNTDEEMEMLFEETPAKKYIKDIRLHNKRDIAQELTGVGGVSSWSLIIELFKRHVVDLQVIGFWLMLGVVIWLKVR